MGWRLGKVFCDSSPDEATAVYRSGNGAQGIRRSGQRVLLEEGLQGEELSFIILTDGKN